MFKWLLDNSLTNRLLVIIASVVLMAYGAFTLSRTPVDVFPDLNKPTVTIMTEAGGMAAEEVEQLITFPLETTMNGLPGVESVRSISSAGLSFLYVTFDWSTDIFRARQLVSERLSSMEEGIAEGVVPRMGPISSIMGEIMQIAIPVDPSKISAMAVREYADWVLRPRLLSVPGVAQVIPIGGEVRQFQVQPNTARMAELGITHEQLEGALKGYSSQHLGRLPGAERPRVPDPQPRPHLAPRRPEEPGADRQGRPADPAAPDRRGDLRRGAQARRRRLRRQAGRDPGHPEAADRRHHRADASPSRTRWSG